MFHLVVGLAAIAAPNPSDPVPPVVLRPATPEPQVGPAEPKPRGNPGTWVMSADYPSAAIREMREGRAAFEAVIDPEGLVSSCVITESSGHKDLDDATCRLVELRARFHPAHDESGKAVSGTYKSAVRWRLPSKPMPTAFTSSYAYTIGADGRITDCEVVALDGEIPRQIREYSPCDRVSKGRFEPAPTAGGNPAGKRVTITFSVDVDDIPAEN